MAMLRLALAQHDFTVGAVRANAERMAAIARDAAQAGAALVAFPELAVCGYPPEDLLLRPSFLGACDEALRELAAQSGEVASVVGFPHHEGDLLYNAAAVLRAGDIRHVAHKQVLPNYAVFDEKRYFTRGAGGTVFELDGVHIGLLICEDVWASEPAARAAAAGAELLLVINASPWDGAKPAEREVLLAQRARDTGCAIAYLNLIGGQDDLLFDGASVLADADGNIAARAPAFVEATLLCDFDSATRSFHVEPWSQIVDSCLESLLYAGLMRGIRDYVGKNDFPGVLLGLSGGIDSALTLALAVDALGPSRVTAVMMPSRYTATLSLDGAREQAAALGVAYHVLPIEAAFESLLDTLTPVFDGKGTDTTEENLQSRIRGVLLMALSNKHGRLLLATGNKSEVAVGYATLYGDMCGGFAPLKDVYKTVVYKLAHWRNAAIRVPESLCAPTGVLPIPPQVIERPPSAELRENQADQDSLPPYDELDAILERFIEGEQSQAEIAAAGFDADTVQHVVHLVLANEFKRRQSAPGPRVTRRAFGRERRYPISSGWT